MSDTYSKLIDRIERARPAEALYPLRNELMKRYSGETLVGRFTRELRSTLLTESPETEAVLPPR